MAWLKRLPVPIVLTYVAALSMLLPAIHASALDEHLIARNFFYAALLLVVLATMVAIAMGNRPRLRRPRDALLTVLGCYGVMPLILALPFAESVPDTGLFNAWWEMVSSATTTGASLYSADLLAPPLHLWRALVGWMGGLFILAAATAILAPLRVGGFELMAAPQDQIGDRERSRRIVTAGPASSEFSEPGHRLMRSLIVIAPVYLAVTLALWAVLIAFGDDAFVALCRALGTLSTSGISPVIGSPGGESGRWGELAVLLCLCFALSRRFWPGGADFRATEKLADDPELHMAAGIVALAVAVLFLRHFIGAIEAGGARTEYGALLADIRQIFEVIWGGIFNAISFLTTTGWSSRDWQGLQAWSGLSSPGLMLAGLAMMGGGVATTAGGVKLLRVYSLAWHGERELQRIIHPSLVAGGGQMARRLRREGAYLAFIFFMLFAISIAVVVLLVSLHRIEFETATILSIAALTNTGQLAAVIPVTPAFESTAGAASAPWEGWSGLPAMTKAVLAGAMIVGRVETLAILALFSPEFWRR